MSVPAPTDHHPYQGLAWTYDLDLEQLLATLGASPPGEAGDERAAAEEAAAEAEDGTARELTGAIADQLPPGPGLAAWVGGTDPAAVGEWDLPGVASAFRRMAAWAQAGELAAVAQMASRSARRDDHVRVDADGRPDQVTPAAGSEVGLELVMSHPAAMAWASLAVTLRWRLAATWAALSAGTIDLYRARLIAEATSPLDDDTAREVESKILPAAGSQTSGQLRAALRRAVIAADPEGAEQRRKDAQRHAKVSLYPDPADGTATLAATRLPSVHAAAAMARLTAMARAMKTAGQAGGLDYLRATAYIGLLLGTLPLTPPPASDPGPAGPTNPDPDAGTPDPDAGTPDPGPGDPGPGDPGPGDPGPGDPGPGDPGAGPLSDPGNPDLGKPEPGGPGPAPDPTDADPGSGEPSPPSDPGPGGSGPADPEPGDRLSDDTASRDADQHHEPRPDEPPPPDPGPPHDPNDRYDDTDDEDDGPYAPDPPADWPPLPATTTQTPPFLGQPPPSHERPITHPPPAANSPPATHPPPRGQPSPPPRGLLELIISWRALTGDPAGPATLSRIGPITAAQARLLALTAAADPHARWQVILTNHHGHAIAVETIRRRHRQSRTRPAGVTSLVAVTIPAATLAQLDDASGPAGGIRGADGRIRDAVLRAARRALAHAQRQEAADAAAPGGCAHTTASPAYRPTTKIRDIVTARDQTCRDPRCRQPARHTDLDHATPWHKGGPTCPCNLGGRCRIHHIIKQLPGWTLIQTAPGHFQLTTPAGRTYITTPDPYPT